MLVVSVWVVSLCSLHTQGHAGHGADTSGGSTAPVPAAASPSAPAQGELSGSGLGSSSPKHHVLCHLCAGSKEKSVQSHPWGGSCRYRPRFGNLETPAAPQHRGLQRAPLLPLLLPTWELLRPIPWPMLTPASSLPTSPQTPRVMGNTTVGPEAWAPLLAHRGCPRLIHPASRVLPLDRPISVLCVALYHA